MMTGFFPLISGEQMKAIVIVAALVLLSFTASPAAAQGTRASSLNGS